MNLSSETANIVMTSILVLVCVCGVIGNTIVLAVGIFKKRYKNNVTNCYIMNLAITDLLFLLISVPLTIYLAIRNVWIFGEFLCKMHIYLAHVLLEATCYTLAAMSIDRYLNVVHETFYRRYRKPKYAFIICILIWILSSAFMFPYDYVLSLVDKHSVNQSSIISNCNVNDDSFASSCFFTFGFYYVLPLTIIGICYSRVSIYIRHKEMKPAQPFSQQIQRTMIVKKRRVQRVLLGLILAFALCWLPIHMLELLFCSHIFSDILASNHVSLTILRFIAHSLSYFNSCLNPFLYALLNKRFFSN